MLSLVWHLLDRVYEHEVELSHLLLEDPPLYLITVPEPVLHPHPPPLVAIWVALPPHSVHLPLLNHLRYGPLVPIPIPMPIPEEEADSSFYHGHDCGDHQSRYARTCLHRCRTRMLRCLGSFLRLDDTLLYTKFGRLFCALMSYSR